MNLPKFSFCIPVYNEEKRVKRCLDSILSQDYPKSNIEILLIDGGSTDRTKDIVSKYECVKVFDNPKKLADFGAKISMQNATGDLFVVFAADNELVGSDWLTTVGKIFTDHSDLACVWGKMISADDDAPLNKYYELIQNDPLSFFINKNLQNYIKIAKIQQINNKDFYVFNVKKDEPLIWGANGLVYRTKFMRDIILRDEFLGDNDVFQIMLENGNDKVAYSFNLNVYHHHLKNIITWVKKWKRNYIKHYLEQRRTRNLRWVCGKNFKTKLILWIIYGSIPIFSIIHSSYLVCRDKNKYWLYHPLANLAQVLTYSLSTLFNKEGWLLIRRRVSELLGNKIRLFK